MRFTMPLTAPCLCTKSTTALQNASLVDRPHSELGKNVDRFMTIARKDETSLSLAKDDEDCGE
jgi:hypothetical protein